MTATVSHHKGEPGSDAVVARRPSLPDLPAGYKAIIIGASGAIGAALVDALRADAACAEVVPLARTTAPPMSFQTWLLYAAAVFVLTVTPGPTVLGIMVCSVIGLGAAVRHRQVGRRGLLAALPQFALIGATFVGFEMFWLSVYSGFAVRMTPWLRSAGRARAFNRATGALFIAAGILLATARRAPA